MAKEEYFATIELAKESRSIALATKNDSSSMKAIAFVTLTFLPATFFAAVFALPSLDWDADESPVIKSKFWVYLAFSIPCTVVVMAAWLGFARYQVGRQRATEKKERRRVATNLSGTNGGNGHGVVKRRKATAGSGGMTHAVRRFLGDGADDDASESESGMSMTSAIVAPNVRRRRLAKAIGLPVGRGSDTPAGSSTRFPAPSELPGSDPPEAIGLWERAKKIFERKRPVPASSSSSSSESNGSDQSLELWRGRMLRRWRKDVVLDVV